MPGFDDKQEFGPEGELESSLPQESSDEEMETELSEEELAAEMKPFTLSEWQKQLPDYTAEELEEKLPERGSGWALVISCLFGTFLGAAIAGVLVNDQPEPRQFRAFFIFLMVLAPLFSCIWYWFFTLRPESIARKMKDEQENPLSSEPIHPK